MKRIVLTGRASGIRLGIASAAPLKAAPKLAVCSAAKAGLADYMRSIAAEYASNKIRASVVCPGFVETKLTGRLVLAMIKRGIPLGESQTPREVAGMVEWLLSGDALNVRGGTFSIDGGMSS